MAGLSVDNVLALRQSILQRNTALKDAAFRQYSESA